MNINLNLPSQKHVREGVKKKENDEKIIKMNEFLNFRNVRLSCCECHLKQTLASSTLWRTLSELPVLPPFFFTW